MFVYFQEGCPTSRESASTESYCDISDSPSSVGDLNISSKKRVTKRPVLPAWQQECLRNYEDLPRNKEKFDEFTKSETMYRYDHVKTDITQVDKRCASDVDLRDSFQSPAIDSIDGSSDWKRQLGSSADERVSYDRQFRFDSESHKAGCEVVSPDHCFDDEVRFSPPMFSTSEYRLTSPLTTLSLGSKISSKDGCKIGVRPYFEKELAPDMVTLEKGSTRNSWKESWKSDASRKKNHSFDFSKSKLRGQSTGGGLLNAVAYFENLEKAAQPERKRFGKSSSLKSFKIRDGSISESFETKPTLSLSPFQLDVSSRGDKYLRELERKTEAQYYDIKEKLDQSSLESFDMARLDFENDDTTVPSLNKLEKVPSTESGYSTIGLRSKKSGNEGSQRDKTFVSNRMKFTGEKSENDGLSFSKSTTTPSSTTTTSTAATTTATTTTRHRIVVTKREYDEDFGFSISERIDGQGIYIKSIQTSVGGSGKLKKYDRLLQVRFL